MTGKALPVVWAATLSLLAYLLIALVDWQGLRDQPELERVTPADVRALMAEYAPPGAPDPFCRGAVLAEEHPPGVVSGTAVWEDYTGAYESLRAASDEDLEALRERDRRGRSERRWADEVPVAKYRDLRKRLAGGRNEGQPIFADRLKSGGQGPAMVTVPRGAFQMGCRSDGYCPDNAKPVHEVSIGAPFALSIFEVTFEEWDACVDAGGCRGYRPTDQGWGRGARPVVCVSWNDATEYTNWLSAQTGAMYGLPSEAEWEYAARGVRRATESENAAKGANCASCESVWGGRQTAPVGSFAPNRFGLYDMRGNVGEWTADCWNEGYGGAPSDGGAWLEGDCSARVLRGGSFARWSRHFMDSSYRGSGSAGMRRGATGFRVVRALVP